jgi:hypothetical protein
MIQLPIPLHDVDARRSALHALRVARKVRLQKPLMERLQREKPDYNQNQLYWRVARQSIAFYIRHLAPPDDSTKSILALDRAGAAFNRAISAEFHRRRKMS